MRRYRGEALPSGCRIAVIANDAIGNFVVSTPLLQMLRSQHRPSALHYYGGKRTIDLQDASSLFDWHYPLHGIDPAVAIPTALKRVSEGQYDLVVNQENSTYAKALAAIISGPETFVVGPCLGPGGRGTLASADDDHGRLADDREWIASDIQTRYPFLDSGFIGEIFCRLCYLEGPVPGYKVPVELVNRQLPDIMIATAASLSEKLWPMEKWISVLEKLNEQGLSVGLLGAPPSTQRQFWKGEGAEEALVESGLVQDLRGEFSLPQVAGAISRAKAVLTIDNGILHLAASVGTPTIGLFRYGIHRLWAPPAPDLTVLTPGEGRDVREIETGTVLEALGSAL